MSTPAVGLVTDGERWVLAPTEDAARGGIAAGAVDPGTLARIEHAHAPRWVWWSQDTARRLVAAGIRPARCWDLGATHRLIDGGGPGDPATVWAAAHGLERSTIPGTEEPTLFTAPVESSADEPIRPDGHLDPEWVARHWRRDEEAMLAWAGLVHDVHAAQQQRLGPQHERTAHAESAAAMICAELEADGLPIDLEVAEEVIGAIIGARPHDADEEARRVAERDALVLRHVPDGVPVDLRNPAHVKSMLRRAGIEVPDTRAWRLDALRDESQLADDLLHWRKAERIATTFGYRWLDEHVGPDGRLRGRWSPSDGAAGRMTATAGLHNLPADLRPAVCAEPGHVFVRADLGQIEPRVLAAVSGDRALVAATQADDLYAPVASSLGVARDVAKVAVLGAMYGQTTGHGAAALASLEREYRVAMDHLRAADEAAQGGRDLETIGGRRIRMGAPPSGDSERVDRSRAAARGRYGRNAVVQGAAAEFFKTWAALVRAACAPLQARIVLCLHDELLVHARAADARTVADGLDEALRRVPTQWGPPTAREVRFVAEISIVERWSDVG